MLPPGAQRQVLFCAPPASPSTQYVRHPSAVENNHSPSSSNQFLKSLYIHLAEACHKHFLHTERHISNRNSKKKKRKRKGKFSRRDDISGALGAMPPADMTRSHRHCMLSWKRKEPLKNKLLHVQYSRKHALWGKAKGGETARTTEMDGNTCVGPHPKDADSGHQKTFSKE